jgi:hypothetical protein
MLKPMWCIGEHCYYLYFTNWGAEGSILGLYFFFVYPKLQLVATSPSPLLCPAVMVLTGRTLDSAVMTTRAEK